MKKIWFYSLMVGLLLAVALSGCGGGKKSGGNPGNKLPFTIAESLVPGGLSFPIWNNDKGVFKIDYPYYIARTEVTYQLWSTVKIWALANGYTFYRPGSCGGYKDQDTSSNKTYTSGRDTDPVTEITWRDAIVWCNALTEYYNTKNGTNYDYAYTSGGNPIKDATNGTVCDALEDNGHNTKGFRLPTSMEWELAARYRGSDSTNTVTGYSNPYFTKGNSASGATAADAEATKAVAWYSENSGLSTHPVGLKTANALGIFDMSGNVDEFCFERCTYKDDKLELNNRLVRGGSWISSLDETPIAINFITSMEHDGYSNSVGFRFVRTE